MPILLSISVLALVALLWAAFSAARHIRRARRRRRRSTGMEPLPNTPGRMGLQVPNRAAEELMFQEVTPYMEAIISRPPARSAAQATQQAAEPAPEAAAPAAQLPEPLIAMPLVTSRPEPEVVTRPVFERRVEEAQPEASSSLRVPLIAEEPPYISAPAYMPKLTYAKVSPFVSLGNLAATEAVPEEEQQAPEAELEPTFSLPAEVPPPRSFLSGLFSSARRQSDQDHAVAQAMNLPQVESQPAAAQQVTQEATPEVTVQPETPSAVEETRLPGFPAARRSSSGLRSASGRHSLASLSGQMERPDWAYFNKDMGDLTDPYETPRVRPRTSPGDSRR